jgi:hypothetical protein
VNEAQRHPYFLFLFFASALLRGESGPFWLLAGRSEAALGYPWFTLFFPEAKLCLK